MNSNFFSLPHSEALVKNFFSEVFELGSRSISGNLCRLPHLVAAVKWFFHSTLWRSAYRADSFVRIPNLSPFVNTFFATFFVFLIFAITPAYFGPSSVQLGNPPVQNTVPVL